MPSCVHCVVRRPRAPQVKVFSLAPLLTAAATAAALAPPSSSIAADPDGGGGGSLIYLASGPHVRRDVKLRKFFPLRDSTASRDQSAVVVLASCSSAAALLPHILHELLLYFMADAGH